jgi:hypothetical protein
MYIFLFYAFSKAPSVLAGDNTCFLSLNCKAVLAYCFVAVSLAALLFELAESLYLIIPWLDVLSFEVAIFGVNNYSESLFIRFY